VAFEAGVVDENVDFAELGDDVGDKLLTLGDHRDVTLECGGFAAFGLDCRYDFISSGFVGTVAEGDVGSFLGEALGDGTTDTLVAAGNCCYFGV